jgi:hypothetical protein
VEGKAIQSPPGKSCRRSGGGVVRVLGERLRWMGRAAAVLLMQAGLKVAEAVAVEVDAEAEVGRGRAAGAEAKGRGCRKRRPCP